VCDSATLSSGIAASTSVRGGEVRASTLNRRLAVDFGLLVATRAVSRMPALSA
jgi:hypothetical protein